ncbi:enkurin [Euwallacea fornicatus]|uniref:enkurin n=1 Tax=Euwallacea fornicatus TaxID=995702 RepID=UPI00338DF129
MSLIFITKHDENIYNLARTQKVDLQKKPPIKHPRKSGSTEKITPSSPRKHHEQDKGSSQKQKGNHSTMGLSEKDPPDPRNYLKKHTGRPSYTDKIYVKQGRICKKLNLPNKGETPPVRDLINVAKNHEDKSNRDFIKDNVKAARHMKPKDPDRRVVVDRMGNRIYPEAQGLEPVHIKRQIFGCTPKYLVRFNKIKEKEYQMKKDMSGKQQPNCHNITSSEREQILDASTCKQGNSNNNIYGFQGLKKNWEELQKQYQRLPILTDTIPKKIKKSKLEAELKQIEKDVALIEKHPCIYVYDDLELMP